MVVEEANEDDDEDGPPKNKNLLVVGSVLAGVAIATFFSKLVPDPSDF
jgi:hypothetical protein